MRTASPKLTRACAVLLGPAALLLSTLAASPASAAESAHWQILSGSRPSNLWEPVDESQLQEVKTEKFFGLVFAAKVEVGGVAVGCLGAGEFGFPAKTANAFCEEETGFPAAETAAEFEEMLEGPYGAGEVEVTGGPVGVAPFEVSTRWGAAAVTLSVITIELEPGFPSALGTANSSVVSEGSGRLFTILTNLGDAPLDATSTPLTITDELPEGVLAYGVEAFAGVQGKAGPVDCDIPSPDLVTCSFEGELPSYEAIEVELFVALEGSPPAAGAPGKVTVSGGDAPSASEVQTVKVSDEPVSFGLEHFSMRAEDEDGSATEQAGAHPFQVTNTVQFNSGRQSGATRRASFVEQPAQPRNTRVTLPAGLVGSATATETCPMAVFLAPGAPNNDCPEESVVGVASVTIIESFTFGLVRLAVPIFNLPPQHGEPARFGFLPVGLVPVLIETSADPDDEYRITGEVRNASQSAEVLSATIVLWGNPGDPAHDNSRGWNCFLFNPDVYPGECEAPESRDETPFLRMPTQCKSPLDYKAELEPWNVPLGSAIEHATSVSDPLLGCNKVPFDPEISSTLTSKLAENPSGLDFELRLPGSGFGDPDGISEAQPKRVEVALPEGVTINPSQAEGLATCSLADYARERSDSAPGEGCPEASKIGSVEVGTPLIEEKLHGALYVAEPNNNPFDSLIAVYIVARSPERGILAKQAIEVRPDPRTGQLVAIADDAPQVPYDYFRLHFREGGRSPLVTPPRCGTFETEARFVPWSAQDPEDPKPEEIVERTASFEIQRGVDGGNCPGGGVPPFEPGFSAGTLSNQAGSYSPFLMRLTRRDGDQDMTKFSSTLPPGVLGKIAGLDRCPEAAIAAAEARPGKEELAAPSCPSSSRIGSTLAGAGVGSVLTHVPGSLYLAGPHNGAPLSVVAITPAVAGPFDVGTVVVRVALRLDPKTARVEADGASSDPIPHILAGIPLKVRDLRVQVDRPQFTLNATSCEPSATQATLWGGFTDVFSAADDVPAGLSARYQAAGCQALGFKPRLRIVLRGGVRRGAHPALRAVVTPRPGDANFARAAVTLPRSAFLEQGHIRTICTRVQFNAGAGNGSECPQGAIYGRARAWSPLLDEPASGPVFLRSSDNELPDLVVALKGPASAPVDVELSARIDSVGGGIRSTFAGIPDVPVSRFILDMQGGEKGLIVNSRHLCHKPERNRAKASLHGQNGRLSRTKPRVIAVECQKRRKATRGSAAG